MQNFFKNQTKNIWSYKYAAMPTNCTLKNIPNLIFFSIFNAWSAVDCEGENFNEEEPVDQDESPRDLAPLLPLVTPGGKSPRRESASMEIMQGFRARKCSFLQVPQPHLDERVVSS